MCLAIYRPAGASGSITREQLECSIDNGNDDSFGLMYPIDGELRVWKSADKKDFNEFVSRISLAQEADIPLVVHQRYATHGLINKNNAHPIEILPGRLALVHNGIIGSLASHKHDDSDTVRLAKMLRQLPRKWWKNRILCGLVEVFLGYSNKVVVMTAKGEVTLLNGSQGKWDNGVWYSNDTYRSIRSAAWGNTWSGADGYWNGTEWISHKDEKVLRPKLQDANTGTTPDGGVYKPDGTKDWPVGVVAQHGSVLCLACLDETDEEVGTFLWESELVSEAVTVECELCGTALLRTRRRNVQASLLPLADGSEVYAG